MNEFDRIAARCLNKSQESQTSGSEPVQLPLWDDDQRGLPAAVARSALFGVVRRGAREAVDNQLLVSWSGNEIRYTGFRLDQSDLDCWLQILHLARLYPLGKEVRFTSRGFLRAIRRSGGGKDQAWLDRALRRMQACGVRLKTADGLVYQGPLIAEYWQDEVSGRYVVRINPLIANLFDDAFVKLSMQRRLSLPQGLARYLQGYVQSHRATATHPHRIGVEQMRLLCGSTSTTKEFRRSLKTAMGHLQAQGMVSDWSITAGDALEFVRG